jgi:hypothetical protein
MFIVASVGVAAAATDRNGDGAIVAAMRHGVLQTERPFESASGFRHAGPPERRDRTGNQLVRHATGRVVARVAESAPSTPVARTIVELPGQVCGNSALLTGPATPPAGAIIVPAGDNSEVDFGIPRMTYWFAPGVHTLGSGEYDQIEPGDYGVFVGAPGAIIDGQGLNRYAFTQHATAVTIEYLTVRGFVAPRDEGVVNHDSGPGWTVQFNTIKDNKGAGLFLGSHNVARYNCLADNGQYGFQVYGGDTPPRWCPEVGGNCPSHVSSSSIIVSFRPLGQVRAVVRSTFASHRLCAG